MSLVRWTGPVLSHIRPWRVSEKFEKEEPLITPEKEKDLYEKYLSQFERTADHEVFLHAGDTVYRGGETQDYEVDFEGAPSYPGAFFGDLSVAAKYYRIAGSAQPGKAPRSVAEMTLLRPLRLFPMTNSNLVLLSSALRAKKGSFPPGDFDAYMQIIATIDIKGLQGGLDANVDFGKMIATVETDLGKYDGFAYYRRFFEPPDTPDGQESRDIFSETSNEQCYVLDARNTFLKTPYVFSDPVEGAESFPNFWGARFPLHPILDQDATSYISEKSWRTVGSKQDLDDAEYYAQFKSPSQTFYADYWSRDSDFQEFSILPAGSIVYRASHNPLAIFSSKSVASQRASRAGGAEVQRLVTATPLLFLVLSQRFLDHFTPSEKQLLRAKCTPEEISYFSLIFKDFAENGLSTRHQGIDIARICNRVYGVLGVAGCLNSPTKEDHGRKNLFGLDLAKQLATQPPEVYLGDTTGVFEETPEREYSRLVYVSDELQTARKSTRNAAKLVRWAPY